MTALRIAYPVYLVPDGTLLDVGTERWLLDQNGDGPLTIADVTDVCAAVSVRAIVTAEDGELLFLVERDGRLLPPGEPFR